MNDLTKQGLTTLGIVLGVSLGMHAIFTIPVNNDVQRGFERVEARLERMEQATNDRFDRLHERLGDTVQRVRGASAVHWDGAGARLIRYPRTHHPQDQTVRISQETGAESGHSYAGDFVS